jgi:hypothetical protein
MGWIVRLEEQIMGRSSGTEPWRFERRPADLLAQRRLEFSTASEF